MLSITAGVIILYLIAAGFCVAVLECDPFEAFVAPLVVTAFLVLFFGGIYLGGWLIYSGFNGGP